jgi:hypothetical protein
MAELRRWRSGETVSVEEQVTAKDPMETSQATTPATEGNYSNRR